MQRRHVLVIGVSALTALVGAFAMAGGVTAQTATATATPTATATSTPTPTATAAPQPDLVAIYRADIDARNRGDITTAISFYTDDAVQVGGGACRAAPCVGKVAVQREAELEVAGHLQLTIVGNPQVSGNVLTSREEHRNDAIRAAGIDRVINNVTSTFIGNKISRRAIEPDLTDAQTAAFARAQAAAAAAAAAAQATPAPPKTGSQGIAGSNAPARWLIVAMVAATLMLVGGVRTATAHRR